MRALIQRVCEAAVTVDDHTVARIGGGLLVLCGVAPSDSIAAADWLAHKIVARHKNYAALGGLVPLPVANIASVTAVNLRMVQQLSKLYEVPFQRDRARSFIVGLIGGAVPTGIGVATSTTLMWIMPGGLLLGLGASAVTAGALTRGIGLVFIESFESGAAAGG